MKTHFIYDRDTDSLAVFTGRRTHASVEVGKEVIVDLDRRNMIVGVEFLNPDKLSKIPKKNLQKIDEASLTSNTRGGIQWAYIHLRMGETEKEIPIPLMAMA